MVCNGVHQRRKNKLVQIERLYWQGGRKSLISRYVLGTNREKGFDFAARTHPASVAVREKLHDEHESGSTIRCVSTAHRIAPYAASVLHTLCQYRTSHSTIRCISHSTIRCLSTAHRTTLSTPCRRSRFDIGARLPDSYVRSGLVPDNDAAAAADAGDQAEEKVDFEARREE
eukprot:3521854-Rhodomonas_salina.1